MARNWETSLSKLTINLPPETEQYEHDIRRFVDAMVYKLRIHANKGRWEDCNVSDMLPRLKDEAGELEQAIIEGNTMEILAEAADVANFAMIISSITVERGSKPTPPFRRSVPYVCGSCGWEYDLTEGDPAICPKCEWIP